jgi:hypothetical protein
VLKSAVISQDRLYRYSLTRVWDEKKRRVMFVGLNPSTADDVLSPNKHNKLKLIQQ